MTTTGPRAAAVVLAAALAFAAGCGGSGDKTSSAEQWANGFCEAVTTWQNDLTSIANNLKQKQSSLTKSDVTSSVDEAKSSTQTLGKSLKDLGKPDTDAGQQAQDEVAQLSDSLSKSVDTVQKAVDDASGAGVAGVLNAVSVASGTLVTMGKEVSSTVSQLEQLDAQGEMKQAFQKASSCKTLVGS